MNHGERFNPFPGPQPYRAADQHRFLGREQVTQRLVNHILARPYLTLFGPSGAGKSSLMQAAVIPQLRQLHGFRTVSVETWHADETPLERLVKAMFSDLELGDVPQEMRSCEAVDEALRLAERYSDRPILIYLDQLEKLLLPSCPPGEADELFESLGALARRPLRGLQLVLALREDYLGRFRDRVRGQQSLQDPGFRLGPLTVKEMAWVACRLAEVGEPAQHWAEKEMRALMLEVRTPGHSPTQEAEIQAAFAQIVCRALWEERAASGGVGEAVKAEPILHRYLEATLEGLGPLRGDAVRLLEEQLVAQDGSRTLLTEQEARAVLGEGAAEQVLVSLERAAVLRSEEHQGSRYFELGHDWLANKVLELKRERESWRKRQKERADRRALLVRYVAWGSTGVAVMMFVLLFLAVNAKREATEQARRAFDLSMMAGAREQLELGQPALATLLLLEVNHPEQRMGWTALAQASLDSNFLELTLHGSGLPLNAAAYSPDGQRIVTAADDGSVRLWSADGSGQPVRLGAHAQSVQSAAFSRNGQRIVTTGRDGTARVWWVDGSKQPIVFKGDTCGVGSAAFSPDGQRIVLACRDGTAQVWWADGSGLLLVLEGHESGLTSAVFSPDGQRIVTTSWDGTARVWRANGLAQPLVLEGHEGPSVSAAFSPDGQRIVTASRDGTVRVWWADGSGSPVVLQGHKGPVWSAAFSPDGQRIVTASDDGTARVWRADGLTESIVLEGHEGPVRSAAFSPDGQHLVTASWDGTARVWRVEELEQPLVLRGHKSAVISAAFSPDGMFIATASRDKLVRLWKSDGSMPLRTFVGHTEPITSIAFSPDGQRIVTASRDKTARVWRTNGWGTPVVLQGHTDEVSFAAFSPDGQRIVTTSWDKTAWVWDADGSGPLFKLEGHKGRVTTAAFSPDGQYLLTADSTGVVSKWRADGMGEPRVVAALERSVNSVAYSSSGQLILTSADDGTARVWQADGSGEPVVFKGHKGPVYFAAFSPDDQFIVTAGNDTTVRVWRANDPTQFNVLEGHAGPVQSATFSPRGDKIVTASWDRTARVWDLPTSRPRDIAVLRRLLEQDNQECLSADMRQHYLDEPEPRARERYVNCERDHGREPAQPWLSRKESRTAGSPKRM
jgi:WD40 repeat protein